jgi:hypothetical protein
VEFRRKKSCRIRRGISAKKNREKFVRGNFGKKNSCKIVRKISAEKFRANSVCENSAKKIMQISS